jgi:hypothetical protein
MRRVAALVTLALALPAPGFAQDWMEYDIVEDAVSVAFPAKPTVEQTTHISEYTAKIPARVYSASAGAQKYKLTVLDYRDAEAIHKERVKSCPPQVHSECMGSEGPLGIGSWKLDVLAAMDNATADFLEAPGQVTHFTWMIIDRVPGRQIHKTLPDGSRQFAAIHQHLGRVYVLDAVVPEKDPEPGLFQQSLQFLDEKGNVIRYYEIYTVGYPPPSRTR